MSSSSSPASSISLIVCRAERGSGASVTPSGCVWSVGISPCYSSTVVQVLHRPSDTSGGEPAVGHPDQSAQPPPAQIVLDRADDRGIGGVAGEGPAPHRHP